jgi:biotin carboxyl carrier protein
MKLQAIVSESQMDVEIRAQGTRIAAVIDGRKYELDLQRASSGRYLLLLDGGRVFDCHVEGRLESGSTVEVRVGATLHAITLLDPKRLRGTSGSGAHGDGVARIVAPMPGKIVRLLVETGQEIEAGSGVIVVEAMKMQNELKSPKSGRVVSINVTVGTTVNSGDLLAVVE